MRRISFQTDRATVGAIVWGTRGELRFEGRMFPQAERHVLLIDGWDFQGHIVRITDKDHARVLAALTHRYAGIYHVLEA